jgi:hypothetical protein
VQRVLINFHENKRIVLIERFLRKRGAANVAGAKFRGAASDEILDASLRFDTFVEMVVPRKHD